MQWENERRQRRLKQCCFNELKLNLIKNTYVLLESILLNFSKQTRANPLNMVLPRALNIENQKNFNRALFNVHMTIKFFVCQTHFSTALHWETNSQKLLLEMTTGLFSSPAPKIEKKGSVTSSKTLKVLGFNHLLRLLERLMDSWPVNPWVFFQQLGVGESDCLFCFDSTHGSKVADAINKLFDASLL